jgi:ubiquinone/menaquinone biosynthesis C-methylase UbiE
LSDFNYSLPLPRTDTLPSTIAERTRRVYDRMAAVYPVSTFLFHAKAHKCALSESGIGDGMRVLEVATGSGEMFRRLVSANPSGTTYGLDLSPNMAARTQRQVREEFPEAGAHCQAVDVRHMPFRAESFDAVVCCYLLELLSTEDVALTLSEFHRVLRPGGIVSMVLIGQNRRVFNRLYRVCGSLVPAFWGRQIERQVPELLAANQLRVEKDLGITQTFYPSRVLVARK